MRIFADKIIHRRRANRAGRYTYSAEATCSMDVGDDRGTQCVATVDVGDCSPDEQSVHTAYRAMPTICWSLPSSDARRAPAAADPLREPFLGLFCP